MIFLRVKLVWTSAAMVDPVSGEVTGCPSMKSKGAQDERSRGRGREIRHWVGRWEKVTGEKVR